MTSQSVIGEISLHAGWLDWFQSLTWCQSKRNRRNKAGWLLAEPMLT